MFWRHFNSDVSSYVTVVFMSMFINPDKKYKVSESENKAKLVPVPPAPVSPRAT